jgi:hypothetical protein
MALDFGIVKNIFEESYEDGASSIAAGNRNLASNAGDSIKFVTYTENNMSGTFHNLPGASITLDVVRGQKVFLMATNDADADASETGLKIQFQRDGVNVGQERSVDIADTDLELNMALQHVDEPGEGRFVYTLQARAWGVAGYGKNDITDGAMTAMVFNS